MATESVNESTRNSDQVSQDGRPLHYVWIGGGESVLTIAFDKGGLSCPPQADQCKQLNSTILGLARALKSVIHHAEDGPEDTSYLMQPAEDIANAIIFFSQLSAAIQSEISGEAAGR